MVAGIDNNPQSPGSYIEIIYFRDNTIFYIGSPLGTVYSNLSVLFCGLCNQHILSVFGVYNLAVVQHRALALAVPMLYIGLQHSWTDWLYTSAKPAVSRSVTTQPIYILAFVTPNMHKYRV